MGTEHDIWLQTLGSVRADMPMTVRGLPVSHTITFSGNQTAATVVGSVKLSPDTTAELATFTVGTPEYSSEAGVTTFPISLTEIQTGGLPADEDGDGRYPYAGAKHHVPDLLRRRGQGGRRGDVSDHHDRSGRLFLRGQSRSPFRCCDYHGGRWRRWR